MTLTHHGVVEPTGQRMAQRIEQQRCHNFGHTQSSHIVRAVDGKAKARQSQVVVGIGHRSRLRLGNVGGSARITPECKQARSMRNHSELIR